MLMYGVLEASTDNIEEYLDEGCVVELAESKREILKHRFGYSDRYERLTGTEMAERLSITRRAVYQSEQILERDIGMYRSKYLSGKDMVNISPAVFDCIRREE